MVQFPELETTCVAGGITNSKMDGKKDEREMEDESQILVQGSVIL